MIRKLSKQNIPTSDIRSESELSTTSAKVRKTTHDLKRTNYCICVEKIVLPQRTNLGLASHIPHGKANVLVVHRLHVEACSK